MSITKHLQKNTAAIALFAVMALTRVHHFGDAFSLPDASLAVFFLAGMTVSGWGFLGVLLLEAGLIDYLAITQFAVSDYCVSPAYVFLIPTYATLWFAGRHCINLKTLKTLELAKAMGFAALATLIAYIISSGSFYVFSGKFAELAFAEYVSRTSQYFLPFLSAALIYVLLGLGAIKLAKSLSGAQTGHEAV